MTKRDGGLAGEGKNVAGRCIDNRFSRNRLVALAAVDRYRFITSLTFIYYSTA